MSVKPEVWRKLRRAINSSAPPNISIKVDISWGTKLDLDPQYGGFDGRRRRIGKGKRTIDIPKSSPQTSVEDLR